MPDRRWCCVITSGAVIIIIYRSISSRFLKNIKGVYKGVGAIGGGTIGRGYTLGIKVGIVIIINGNRFGG